MSAEAGHAVLTGAIGLGIAVPIGVAAVKACRCNIGDCETVPDEAEAERIHEAETLAEWLQEQENDRLLDDDR